MTDIRLDTGDDGETIALDCNVLVSNGAVLQLKSPANTPMGTGIRRALVHTSEDGLSINGRDDYTDGVSIAGVKSIQGREGVEERGLQLENVGFISGKDVAAPIDPHVVGLPPPTWTKRLWISGEIEFQLHPGMGMIGMGVSNYRSLQDLLNDLRKEIAALKTRVSELESK
jgi:hypothetical protein